ncbi:MAG: FAD-binding protein [Clostridia bacterium]|nr:FAD-binding protein [Clostridia bacterium]
MNRKIEIPMPEYDVVIIGTGAAGLNAADTLFDLGITNIAIVTEGRFMGTSRNTGSDKQTYYKISTCGAEKDSIYDMAKTLFSGGSMNGDHALIEAAYSGRSFYKLVNLGLPFPQNEYGEYVGYMTDHDKRKRATSCGPLTSKLMVEALEKSVYSKGIPVISGERVVKIVTENKAVCGVVTVNKDNISDSNPFGATYFIAKKVILATGGPSAIYDKTVYPESQTCSHGVAFECGCEGINLTESQYGIASTQFRWNLSGTYQQVIPTYISVDKDGNSREFLNDIFDSKSEMFNAIFMKGYQWPFDPAKVNCGTKSSKVDLAVFNEIRKGNKVYLDYTKNPTGFDFDLLPSEAKTYLSNSNALFGTPISRLKVMNTKAINLYKSHGIDLEKDLLEIAVCAQHNNGGINVDINYMSTTIKDLYIVGECAGIFGIHRPGGTALNSTQVGSLRAAQNISKNINDDKCQLNDYNEVGKVLDLLSAHSNGEMSLGDILTKRAEYGKMMSENGAFLRSPDGVMKAISYFENELNIFDNEYRVKDLANLAEIMINRDIVITSFVYLNSILKYIENDGLSRGSYLISNELFPSNIEIDKKHFNKTQIVSFKKNKVTSKFVNVRKIPNGEQWFETVYNKM